MVQVYTKTNSRFPKLRGKFGQFQTSSGKSENFKFDGRLKNKFLQLKRYIRRIYLTLLSTTCVKIHQIPFTIFETISYFSRHNSSLFFYLEH